MAKTNNLTDFLTDVANAIRTKKNTTAKINPQDFSTEIGSIQTGVDPVEMATELLSFAPSTLTGDATPTIKYYLKVDSADTTKYDLYFIGTGDLPATLPDALAPYKDNVVYTYLGDGITGSV